MKGKTLLLLAALTALLGAFIFFYEKDLPSTDERRALDKKIFAIDDLAQHLGAIELHGGAAADGLRLEKDGETWRLRTPLEARADLELVRALTSRLEDLEKTRTVDDLIRADAGLEPPDARVVLTLDDGRSLVLEIGDEIPGSSARLVAVGEAGSSPEKIHAAKIGVWEDLQRAPGDWRDKQLFPHVSDAIERLRLLVVGDGDGDGEIVLARDGDDFRLEAPLRDVADRSAAGRVTSALTNFTAVNFLDAAPDDFAPHARLEVELVGSEDPFVLEWGEAADLYRVDGQMVRSETQIRDHLAMDAEAWRSPTWTDLQVYKIDEAVCADADGEMRLRREDGDWLRNDEPIGYTAASDLLYALIEVRAEEIRDARPFAWNDAELRFELIAEDAVERLAFRGLADGRAEVVRESRDAVLVLGAKDARKVRDKMTALREAEVRSENADDVEPLVEPVSPSGVQPEAPSN